MGVGRKHCRHRGIAPAPLSAIDPSAAAHPLAGQRV